MQQLRVLVVEDEQVVAADFGHQLARMGCEVVGTAVAGREAVEKALHLRPDIVLMDIRLQCDMDGIEAARLIQGDTDIPIVFVTAFGSGYVRNVGRLSHPYICLLKPVGRRQLQTIIDIMKYTGAPLTPWQALMVFQRFYWAV